MDANMHMGHSMATTAGSNVTMDMGQMGQEGHMGMMHGMMMMMYFHFETGMDTVLFKTWKPSTTGQMVGSCLGIFFLTVFYEAIKYAREMIHSKQTRQEGYGSNSYVAQLVNSFHLLQTVLHALQYLVSYLLMLIVMTYQGYFLLSIIAGSGVGYLIYAPLTAKLKARYETFGDPCC